MAGSTVPATKPRPTTRPTRLHLAQRRRIDHLSFLGLLEPRSKGPLCCADAIAARVAQ